MWRILKAHKTHHIIEPHVFGGYFVSLYINYVFLYVSKDPLLPCFATPLRSLKAWNEVMAQTDNFVDL